MSDTLGFLLALQKAEENRVAPSRLIEAHDKFMNFDVPDKDYIKRLGYPVKAFEFLPKDAEINLYPPHEVPARICFDGKEQGAWITMIGQWWEDGDVDPDMGIFYDLLLFISENGNEILVGKGEKDNDGVYRIVVSESTKWKEWAPLAILPPALYWACKNLIFEPKCDLPL